MRNENIVKSKLTCPKCKSKDLYVNEIWKNHEIQFDQENGYFDREDGVLNPGESWYLTAECKKCNHFWRVRNAYSIGNIY